MEFQIYQWLVPIIGLFYMVRIIRGLRQKKRSPKNAFVWLVFWIVIIILAIIPNEISFKVAEVLGFASNINAIIFVALGLLFLFVSYLSNSVEKLEQRQTTLVRDKALQAKKYEQSIKEAKIKIEALEARLRKEK